MNQAPTKTQDPAKRLIIRKPPELGKEKKKLT
jgi:hypothetical protein